MPQAAGSSACGPFPWLSFSCSHTCSVTSLLFPPVPVNLRHPKYFAGSNSVAQMSSPSPSSTFCLFPSLCKPLQSYIGGGSGGRGGMGEGQRTKQRRREKNSASLLAQTLPNPMSTESNSVQINCWLSSFPIFPQFLCFFRAASGTLEGGWKEMPQDRGDFNRAAPSYLFCVL